MDISSLSQNLDEFVSQIGRSSERPMSFEDSLNELIEFLRSVLNEKGIRITYEPPANISRREDTKIVLSVNKHKADFDVPLVRECGGIVLSIRHPVRRILSAGSSSEPVVSEKWTWRWLAVPPGEFGPNPPKRVLKSNLTKGKYKVFEAIDGTTVCLYNHSGGWHMSTKNGYDVTNLSWRGITYNRALREVLSQYKEFSWGNLNPECCYTIGFRHPIHHPFQPAKKAWFISACNTLTMEDADNVTGLEEQRVVEEDLPGILHKAENALATWEDVKEANYGYVLRSQDPTKPDLFIESTLMCRIREFIYHMKFIPSREKRIKSKQLFSNIKYVVLRAYLDPVRRELFIRLFPQFQHIYDDLDVFINKLVQKITRPKADFEVDPTFLDRIRIYLNKEHPRISSRTKTSIIRDVLTTSILLDLYAEYLLD